MKQPRDQGGPAGLDINFLFTISQSIFLAAAHPFMANTPIHLGWGWGWCYGTEWAPLILSRAPPMGSAGYCTGYLEMASQARLPPF